MLPDKKVRCHRTGFTKSCYDMVTKNHCRLWKRADGVDPQDPKKTIDVFGCLDEMRHWFALEHTRKQHEAGAAIESLRNEFVRNSDRNLEVMMRVQDEFRRAIVALGQEVLAIGEDKTKCLPRFDDWNNN